MPPGGRPAALEACPGGHFSPLMYLDMLDKVSSPGGATSGALCWSWEGTLVVLDHRHRQPNGHSAGSLCWTSGVSADG